MIIMIIMIIMMIIIIIIIIMIIMIIMIIKEPPTNRSDYKDRISVESGIAWNCKNVAKCS